MNFLQKKNRRLRGAELVLTGGITMFLSSIVSWLAPAAFCIYGIYRWLFRKSYKDGITSLALGIILMVLLKGPLSFLLWLSMAVGGVAVGIGGVMMLLPSKKSGEVEVKPSEVEDYE